MVHALEEIHRLLKPSGALIDIHPLPEKPVLKVFDGGILSFMEPKPVTYLEDIRHADDALKQIVNRGQFIVVDQREFDYRMYASSISELQIYEEIMDGYDDVPMSEVILEQQTEMYARAGEFMLTAKEEAEVVLIERCRIARMKPVQ